MPHPLIVALITAKLLNGLRLSGLAAIAGFCTTVYLAADFNFEPLTVVKKIILCGLAAAIVAPMLDLALRNGRFIRYLIAAAGGSAALWVFWSIFYQKETPEAAIYGIGITSLTKIPEYPDFHTFASRLFLTLCCLILHSAQKISLYILTHIASIFLFADSPGK